MTTASKVWWGEEWLPHSRHVRQQDRCHAARLDASAGAPHPYCRGVQAPPLPAALPVTIYFLLENRGVPYDGMLKAQAIPIHVPDGLHDHEPEPIAIAA